MRSRPASRVPTQTAPWPSTSSVRMWSSPRLPASAGSWRNSVKVSLVRSQRATPPPSVPIQRLPSESSASAQM